MKTDYQAHFVITRVLITLLTVLLTNTLLAFNPPPLRPRLPLLDTTIMKMNLNLVPTGILEDFGETPVNLDAFNGVSTLCDTNYVNFRTLNGILSGLASSKVRADMDIPSDLTELMSQYLGNGINPVGVVVYKYNHTNDFALANHLLVEADNQIFDAYDTGGNWVNPYDDKYVVAFSPYINVSGGCVTYRFRTNLTFTNETIRSIIFDAGDGNGYREIAFDSNIQVTYSNPGFVELKLRITLSNNAILDTHSFVTVLIPSAPTVSTMTPDYEETFTCDSTYLGYTKTVEGMMSVKYAPGHTSLVKPLIVAEGFEPFLDPDGIMDTDGSGRGFCNIDDIIPLKGEPPFDLDYDIVYIDWNNSCAPIQSNAEILRKVIDWVNANKTSTEKNILIGQSMGGLIARYTLRKMEQAGIPHDVKVYVSDDSPHYGVNVPMGYVYALQYWLGELEVTNTTLFCDLLKFIDWIFNVDVITPNVETYISEIYNLREAPSVRQMLMHYISPGKVYDSQMYNDFQTVLNTIGFPQGDAGQGIMNLTISNGGLNTYSNNQNTLLNIDCGAYGGLIAPIVGGALSSFLYGHNHRIMGLLSGIAGTFTLFSGPRIQFNVYPNYQATQEVYDYTFSWKKYRGLLKGEVTVKTDSFDAPPASLVYESDAGSYYELQDSAIVKNINDSNAFLGGYFLNAYINNRFLFVPSVSSLAYKNQRTNITRADRIIDFTSVGIDMDKIPFDGYKFVRDTASYHTHLNSVDIRWIDRASSLFIEPTLDILISGQGFTLNDTTVFVRWSVADTTVATINPTTGVVNLVNGGSTTAYADIDVEGGHLRLSRGFTMEDIPFPGFPTYVLSQTSDPSLNGEYSGSYTVQARESTSVNAIFRPLMTCHWGIKSNTNDSITWTTRPYSPHNRWLDYFCYFPENASARMVYFYVSYRNQVSPTYSVFCRIPPAIMDPLGSDNGETE